MLRPDARIVEARRNGMGIEDLSGVILQQICFVPVQNTGLAAIERGGMHACLDAVARRLHADQLDALIFEEGMEEANRV